MFEALTNLSHMGLLATLGLLLLGLLVYLTTVFIPIVAVLYLIYFLLTLPMRRNERARLFLDLLEMGLKDGQSPEIAVMQAAASHDTSLGVRTFLLAEHLHEGRRLSEALARVPRLLPPQVTAVLKAGERIGDVAKVLPACRRLLADGVSQVRGALNYVLLLSFVITPLSLFIPLILRIKVLPSFKAVFDGMLEGSQLPPFTRFVFEANPLMTLIQLALVLVIWTATVAYIGGPRLRRWIHNVLPFSTDWLLYRLPWRRKRLQRDFSAMLALLLDAGVPEAEAVSLAGEATANVVMARRANRVRGLLNDGIKLPDAIRALDDSAELRWRLANVLRRSGSFVQALNGWHDALDARAFQLEQAAAQTLTSFMVLLNGLIVASIVIGMFLAFIQLINQAVLW